MQSTRSPKDTSVKLFTSEAVGAPSLTQAAGALIDVLSACLVNGFGMQQVSSFTVTAGVGQITVPAATGWERMCVIDVAGCADTSYNGEYKLSAVTADGLRVSFPIDAPDGTVQGAAITVKLAPAGWLLRFADPATNKAVYMPGTPQWAGHCLRVEDVAGSHAYVRAYESMTDVDTGLGAFPTTAQVANAAWSKAAGTTRPSRWMIVADDRLVWAGIASGYATSVDRVAYAMRWFGKFNPLLSQDTAPVTISVQEDTSTFSGATWRLGVASLSFNALSQKNIWAARSIDGTTISQASFISPITPVNLASGDDTTSGSTTGFDVGNLIFLPKYLRAAVGGYPRAQLPGVLHLMHTGATSVVGMSETIAIEGRSHKLFPGPAAAATTIDGTRLCAVDIEGPWA